MTVGITVILWQAATIVQARRAAALLRWSIAVQGVGLVLDATWRPAAAVVHALGVVMGALSIVDAVVALGLLLAGVAAILWHIRPRPPRRRARFAV